jgi:hypothetical protein
VNRIAAADGETRSPGWQRWAGPCVILLAAAIASAPVWIHGVVGADDFEFHLVSWLDAQHGWLHGIPYPHWAVSPNFGAGEPRFVFYPPLTWMLGAALSLVLPRTLLPVAMTFLLLAATGLATRALARVVMARQGLGDAPATLAGCAAIFSCYTLFTAYDRTAFGEFAGGFWIPLLLLFILRDNQPGHAVGRRALDGSALPLALAMAGCWLSDAPVGVMGSYLLAGVALLSAATARSWFPVLRAAVATPLGIGLAAVYLIPAAWEQRWVDIQQATGLTGDSGLRIESNWLFPHHTEPALHLRDLSLHWISPIAVFTVAMAMASLLAIALQGRLGRGRLGQTRPEQAQQRRTWFALGAIPLLVLFLLLPWSLPIWNLLPKLRFLQFPWRWLLVVEAPMAVLFAAAVWPAGAQRRRRMVAASLCAVFFVGTTAFAAKNFFRDAPEDDDLETILAQYSTGTGFIGTDEYAPPEADNSVIATGLPDACITDDFDTELGVAPSPEDNPVWKAAQGSCLATATAQLRQPERMRIAIVAPRDGFLVLKLRTYPAWRVTLNGKPATNPGARADGLMVMPVSAGPVQASVEWRTTPDVVAGRCVSGLALLGLVGLWLVERRLARSARR